jgi:hypothetical protein
VEEIMTRNEQIQMMIECLEDADRFDDELPTISFNIEARLKVATIFFQYRAGKETTEQLKDVLGGAKEAIDELDEACDTCRSNDPDHGICTDLPKKV